MVGLKLFNRHNLPVVLESVGRCKYKLIYDGSLGMTMDKEKTIYAIDPSGGPYISLDKDLSEYVLDKKNKRRNLVVDKIKIEDNCYVIYTKKK